MAEKSSSIRKNFKIRHQISFVKCFFNVKTTLLETSSLIHFRTADVSLTTSNMALAELRACLGPENDPKLPRSQQVK
jgi:hypothetical protein